MQQKLTSALLRWPILVTAALAVAAGCGNEGEATRPNLLQAALTANVTPTEDATVRDGMYAGANYGGNTALIVKRYSTGWNRWSYLKFDLSGTNGDVQSAKLRLHGTVDAGWATTTDSSVHGVADNSWGEGTITWNTRPAPGEALATVTVKSGAAADYEWDVTAYVRAELAAGRRVITLAVGNPNGSTPYTRFAAREAGANGPALVLETTTPTTPIPQPEPLVTPPPPVAAPSPAPTSGSPVIAGCPMFPADNEWNRSVANDPVDPNSANYIAAMGGSAGRTLHPDFGGNGAYGIPWITVSGSQAKVPMSFDYSEDSDPGPYPFPADAPIEGGADSSGDRHVLVLDRDNCKLYETWDSHRNGDGWHCGSGAIFDLRSNALRPERWTSADAAGLPILPGLIRHDEVAAGKIAHALRFTIRRSQRAYVHPATHFASTNTDPNLPPMGLRVRLRADYDISRFSRNMQVVLKALKEYGMFLADNGGDWFITGEANPAWNDEELHQLKSVPVNAFEVVKHGQLYK